MGYDLSLTRAPIRGCEAKITRPTSGSTVGRAERMGHRFLGAGRTYKVTFEAFVLSACNHNGKN